MSLEDALKELPSKNLEEKLFTVPRNIDKESHVKVDTKICLAKCKEKFCANFCPSGTYKINEKGETEASFENCLECGSCLVGCPYEAITWKYPRGGFGVNYRFG